MSTYTKRIVYGETDPPEFLDTKFFEKLLRKHKKNETIKLIYFEMGRATNPGDNFTSMIFRAGMDYTMKIKDGKSTKIKDGIASFIIKVPPLVEGTQTPQSIDASVFDTEIKMYTVTLPEIQRLMEVAGVEKLLTPT